MESNKILDSEFEEPIYYHDGRDWFNVPTIGRFLIVGGIFSIPFTFRFFFIPSLFLFVLGIGTHIYNLYTKKSSYKVYSKTIYIFNWFKPRDKYILRVEDILSINYNNISFDGGNVAMEITLVDDHSFEGLHEFGEPLILEIKSINTKTKLIDLFNNFGKHGIPVFNWQGGRIV